MSAALDFAAYDVAEAEFEYEDLPPRLLALREKIRDSSYLDNAINRIASVISRNMVDNPDELHLNAKEGLN
ncbi:MAG: hypothetical protein VZQ47_12625 [Treponema sp.]|nr:hypothetical protein [Treponema sp.]MEE3436387.1 hypothetical protein [Treponema sp.]